MKRLWNPTNRLSLFNVDRESTNTRYGIAHWLNADGDMKDMLMSHFRYVPPTQNLPPSSQIHPPTTQSKTA